MKSIYIFVFVFTTLFSFLPVFAQWTQSDGIYGGYCGSVAFNGSELFTGTFQTGLHKSVNQGVSWQQTQLNGGACNAIAAGEGYIVAGINSNIYKSTDGGTTWTQTIAMGKNVACLVSQGNKVYAGINVDAGGVYYSVNGGSNWIQTSLQANINAVAVKGDTLFAGDKETGIYRSMNGGIDWTGTSLGWKAVSALTVSGDYLIAGVWNGSEMWISSDNGDSWIQISLPGHQCQVYSLASNDDLVFAGIRDWYDNPLGIWVSDDHGFTWTQTSLSDKHVISLATSGSNVLAGTLYYGAYFSTDSGLTWTQTALNAREVFSLESVGNQIFAGTGYTNYNNAQALGGVYGSSDGGNSWTLNGITDRHVFSLEALGDKLYAGTAWLPQSSNGGVLVSDDLGNAWTQTMLNNFPVLSLSANGQNMYAGLNGDGIYYSPDGGTSWWQTKMTGNTVISLLACSEMVLAGTGHDHGIFRSTDQGETWSHVLNDISPTCFAQMDTILFCGSNYGIHRSFDNGLSWTRIPLPYQQVNSLAVQNNTLFIATNTGVFYSTDKGEQWIEMNQGFNGVPVVTSLLISDNFLYVGTKHYSVWQRSISEILSAKSEPPAVRNLGQNYPNPVNGKTRISFELHNPAHVRLVVYNMAGNLVATLIDNYTNQGNHTIEFDASNLPPGMYLYRIETSGQSISKKMMRSVE